MRYLITVYIVLLFASFCFSQSGEVSGTVTDKDGVVEFSTVYLKNTNYNSITNKDGYFTIQDVPYGQYTLVGQFLGYKDVIQSITISKEKPFQKIEIQLEDENMTLDQIVVTGTKTFKRQTESPVIVNVINHETLDNVQACNLSEGLKFQPGLRIETDCQTCNYTQLRMNGLGGGYSQILINGRPIFSPLTGLYGMEQLPVNMIDRIEVVKGGGSSLYGSSAIGGTVNVLTKIPKKNSYDVSYNYQLINGDATDNNFLGNMTFVYKNKMSGVSLFINKRIREIYDHNGDNFSELPELENTSIGTNIFVLPKENQKIEFSFSYLNEYRYGGEMIDAEPHLTQQAEERTHNVWMSNVDYQINFNDNKSSLITYIGWQKTIRDHFTGISPDEEVDVQFYLMNPPYGNSDVNTLNTGFQFNHRLDKFLLGKNTLTLGIDYVYDSVFDDIPSYNFLVDQTTKDFGFILQSDWSILPNTTLLTGFRVDDHNLVNNLIFSPRASLLYRFKDNTQFRLNYGTGFRAPQAFDTDLHIAFAGGGVSRVALGEDLTQENSKSLSGSINYDKAHENYIFGFTFEAFYTALNNAFVLDPIGEDEFGEVFIKRNGQNATVKGTTVELRANYHKKYQLESGFTIQSSKFDNVVQYIDDTEGIKEFIRTPNIYGFANLNVNPNASFGINFNYVYTGAMKIPHFAGAPNQLTDEIISSRSFHEFNLKLNLTKKWMNQHIEFFGGIKNLLNQYQDDFDIGKNRDSNFVYGTSVPRTFFMGIKLRS